MWAIRKEHLQGVTMSSLISTWAARHDLSQYVGDQYFLVNTIYRPHDALIHDRHGRFEAAELHAPFNAPLVDNLFVGQVHLFREDGTEYAEFTA